MPGLCRFRREVTVARGVKNNMVYFERTDESRTVQLLKDYAGVGRSMLPDQQLTRDALQRLRKALVDQFGEATVARVNVLVRHDFRKTFGYSGSQCSLR